MDFFRQLYERRDGVYEISTNDILDTPARKAISNYMESEFGVDLQTALDALNGGNDDFSNDDQTIIIHDALKYLKDPSKYKACEGALYYCFYRCYGRIIGNYKMFLGSNPSMIASRMAGERDGKSAYIAYAYFALAGDFSSTRNIDSNRTLKANTQSPDYIGLSHNALELYNTTKLKSSTPFGALAQIFDGCLKTIIRTVIPRENAKGINYDGEITKTDLTSGSGEKLASVTSLDKEIDDEHSGATTVGEKVSSEKGGYKTVEQELFGDGNSTDLDEWINFCLKETNLYTINRPIKKSEVKDIGKDPEIYNVIYPDEDAGELYCSDPEVYDPELDDINNYYISVHAWDDFTGKKRPIFACDVLKAYIRALEKYKGETSQNHVNEELKNILGLDKLQPMQWKAAGHNADKTDTPNDLMITAIKNSGLRPEQIAGLITNYGSDKLIEYIDDQLD
jgi:hypothetical protein